MTLSQKRIEEFITIYEETSGGRLSAEAARPIAERLLIVYRLITQTCSSPQGD